MNFFQLKFHLMRVQLRSNKNFANNGKSQVVVTPLINVKVKIILTQKKEFSNLVILSNSEP